MFKRSRPTTDAPDADADQEQSPHGKGRPTPTRKEREAARKRPLVPKDRKEAARRSRRVTAQERNRAREGMAAGDDRYLTKRDKGPQRRYVRDYVDARFSVGEFLMPLLLIIIVLSMLPDRRVQELSILFLWFFFLLLVADSLLLGFLVVRRIGARFGTANVERGLRWYAIMRAAQLRMIRLPKPQVKRRQYPT